MSEKLKRKVTMSGQTTLATALFILAYLAVMGMVFAPKTLWLSQPTANAIIAE